MAAPNPNRFATLLKVRKHQADQKAWALAEIQRRIQAADAERDRMLEEQKRMFARAAELVRTSFDAQDIQRYYQYERHLARLASEKDAEIVQLKGEEHRRRRELDGAMVKKRIAERLDGKSRDAFDAFVLDNERKLLDELAGGRAWRLRGAVSGE